MSDIKNKKIYTLLILAIFLIGVPLTVDRLLSTTYQRLNELADLADCYPFPCTADFNGNKTLDRLELIQKNPDDRFDWWLVVTDGESELFSIPYNGTDNSFRTHAAIYKPARIDFPRLLIFDGTKTPVIKSAYAWDGNKLSEVKASIFEEDILTALESRDDTGTFHLWIVWDAASTFLLPIYYLVVSSILILFGVYWFRQK